MTCTVSVHVVFGMLSDISMRNQYKIEWSCLPIGPSLIFTLLGHLWLGLNTYKRSQRTIHLPELDNGCFRDP